jgi:hypothetical protein
MEVLDGSGGGGSGGGSAHKAVGTQINSKPRKAPHRSATERLRNETTPDRKNTPPARNAIALKNNGADIENKR